MKTYKVTNTFHNTFAAFRMPDDRAKSGLEALNDLDGMAYNGDAAAKATLARVYRKLCGIKGCECKGMIRNA